MNVTTLKIVPIPQKPQNTKIQQRRNRSSESSTHY